MNVHWQTRERDSHCSSGEPADQKLTLCADVKKTAFEGKEKSQRSENYRGRLRESLPDVVTVSKSSYQHGAIGIDRRMPSRQKHYGSNQKSRKDGDRLRNSTAEACPKYRPCPEE
jgi:hypothetical protein